MPNLHVSHIGVVPEADGSAFSINEHIDPQFTTVTYTSFETVVQTIGTIGPRALLAKLDIEMLLAFCQFTQGTLNFWEFTLMGLITPTDAFPLGVQYRAKY